MIACIENGAGMPCVVREIARKGLSVKATTWCNVEHSAADGVVQLPDGTKPCSSCATALEKAIAIGKLAGTIE